MVWAAAPKDAAAKMAAAVMLKIRRRVVMLDSFNTLQNCDGLDFGRQRLKLELPISQFLITQTSEAALY